MCGLESIIHPKQPIRLLTALLKKGTIPHALLFTGIEGVGKLNAALAFAMACNCTAQMQNAESRVGNEKIIQNPTDPCGACRSCRKIKSGNHPDIIIIEPYGPLIRIDQIRALCHTLAMKPYEARLRVVIISEAQAMNPEAGNALLKVLEEPPDRTILILTATQTSDLLPTIVSRCQHIRFNPISRKSIEALLIKEQGIDPDNAMIIAAMANGSFSKALAMHKANWINQRNWLINEVESLSSRPICLLLAFAERLSKNKETIVDSLEVMKSWFRDLVICNYDTEKIINKDLTDKIRYASQKITVNSLLLKIKAIQTAQKDIGANTNLRLALEVMIMRLAKIS